MNFKNILIIGIIVGALGVATYLLFFKKKQPAYLQEPTHVATKIAEAVPSAAVTPEGLEQKEPVTTVKNKQDFDKIINNNTYAVVKLSATWCPPCKLMKPIFENLATKMASKMKFVEIDIDDFDDAKIFNARGIPVFIIYKNGKEHSRVVGAKKHEELSAELEKVVS